MDQVIIMGSGPGVLRAQGWTKAPDQLLVAINNAWRVRPDWDWLIHPEDFPEERRPKAIDQHQRIATASVYVPVQNSFGGFVYAGGTMAFTSAYWALGALRPRVIAMIGCDMVYPVTGHTHFYGTGEADPLRPDITLRRLEAKSARLMVLAAAQGCAMVNLSTAEESRLLYPRMSRADLAQAKPRSYDPAAVAAALTAEAEAGYMVVSGRYWEEETRFDPAVIDRIDALWLEAAETGLRSDPACETAPSDRFRAGRRNG
ncbi:MAG: hypothetical protein MUF74_02465 [Cypionkella sp.]|nr:hypothetical protein [Cypionkella sp.]